jgi:hypothetical protein
VDPRAGQDDVEKRKFMPLSGLELHASVVQPVASRYTDYAIPAPRLMRWSPHWVHSAHRPFTGLLYLPRVIVKIENLVE